MIDSNARLAKIAFKGGARGCRPVALSPAPRFSPIAATALFLALMLQAFNLQAELLFRVLEQGNGHQGWSVAKNYADPADTAHPRALEDGAQVSVQEVQVFLQGTITQRDVYGAKVMESLIKRGRQTIIGNAVSLAGNGGDVDAAMELGRVLRRLGVFTQVAQGDECLSSCVFAFMGGDRRTVAGRIGIHRPFFSSTQRVPDRRAHYRQLQKRLQQYIEELDFPPSLYEAVMAVPSESIIILSAADLKRFYLQGMSPSAQDEANATAARNLGVSVMEYLQQKAQRRACAGVAGAAGVCDSTTAAGRDTAAADPREPSSSDGALPAAGNFEPPNMADEIDSGEAHPAPASSWTRF